LLVCDEAQHLSADLLEELRLLGNLETRQGKAVLVLLASLPEIGQMLKRPELAVLSQRLAARATLGSLAVPEAADYLVHHLRLAGGRPEQIITDEALEILAQAARGVPRLLNQAAHQALALACTAGAEQVDAEAALEAIARLGLELEPPAEASLPPAEDIEPEETPADQASPRLFNLPKRPA
jgi:type II secretory pathway predicted ATPase ExeA